MQLNIRPATVQDAADVAQLVTELTTNHIGPSLNDDGLKILLASMDTAATRERVENGWLHLVAYHEARLVGIVVVKPTNHLYHLYVDSEYHHQGIARRLFALADAHAHQNTGSPLQTVNASLNAISVYQRFGFAIDGPLADNQGVRYQPMIRSTAEGSSSDV